MFRYSLVEVFPAKMRVPVGGENFENAIVNCQQGNIERPSAEIEDENVFLI